MAAHKRMIENVCKSQPALVTQGNILSAWRWGRVQNYFRGGGGFLTIIWGVGVVGWGPPN